MKIKELFSKINFKKINLKEILKNKKKRRIFIISAIVFLILVVGLSWFIKSRTAGKKSATITAQVTRGTVSNVIEGTGTVEAISQYEISSLAKGDVIADYFEEGDYVEKDQLLYEIDSASLDKNIQKQQTSIERARMNYDEAVENVSNLNVKPGINGVVTNLYVSVGDNVQSGTKVAEVIDRSTLLLTVPFGEDDAKNIYYGQNASVILANSFASLNGKVTSVGTGTYINSYGVNVTDVEIVVSNPGTVVEGELATAKIGDYACYDSAELEYVNKKTVVAETSGEVQKVLKKKGDSVRANEAIAILYSKNASKNAREAQISLNDASLSLDDLYDDLEDYKIKSPIAGKVIQKNIKAGEKLETNSAATMAIVADLSALTFDINIDELDISSIKVGQAVSVEADAMEGRRFTGKVTKISIVGESYQGVTSYPVTITIDNSEETGLIPGMNVSAQITVESVENVLRIPVSALKMGSMVIAKDDGSFADVTKPMKMPQNKKMPEGFGKTENKGDFENKGKFDKEGNNVNNKNEKQSERPQMPAPSKEDVEKANERMKTMLERLDIPDGYVAVRVQTGLSDGAFIEIKEVEGSLKEGDTVLLPDTTAATTQTQRMPGMGGMSGGMRMPGGMGGFSGGGMQRTGGFSGGMNRQGNR